MPPDKEIEFFLKDMASIFFLIFGYELFLATSQFILGLQTQSWLLVKGTTIDTQVVQSPGLAYCGGVLQPASRLTIPKFNIRRVIAFITYAIALFFFSVGLLAWFYRF